MTVASPNPAPSNDFDRERFRRIFPDLVPRIVAEWPEVDELALSATAGDVDATIALVAGRTLHSKALVRKHLAEILDLDVPGRSPVGSRLARVLEALEATVGPLEEEAERVASKVSRAVEDAESEGRALVRDARKQVNAAEHTMRGNFWTTLFVTLGLGALAGFVFGRRHGRR
jgi:ElaB/YqjD/DUF883 family membrane-anchored ribosome-binding protein